MIRIATFGDIHFGPEAQGTLRPMLQDLPYAADLLLRAARAAVGWLLEGVADSLTGQRLISEAPDHVQMGMGNVLSTNSMHIPADGVSVRTVGIEQAFGLG